MNKILKNYNNNGYAIINIGHQNKLSKLRKIGFPSLIKFLVN